MQIMISASLFTGTYHVQTISSVGVVDEGSVSAAMDDMECGQDLPHCEELNVSPLRKKSLSLPTVHLPTELQSALDTVVSSKLVYMYSCNGYNTGARDVWHLLH